MPLRIASLGSSFAAGPNIPPVADSAAARSGANYACLVADRLGATLTDLSVSGATLLNLLDVPQDRGGRRFAPQIDDLPADTNIVLVLGGGNDMNYIGALMDDTLSRSWAGSVVNFFRGSDPDREERMRLQSDTDAVAERYARVLDAIHARAPDARVLVVEYQAILGPETRPGKDVVLDADRIDHHRMVATNLLKATQKATSGREAWCSVVDVSGPSEAHAIGCSLEPWIAGFTWKLWARGGAYHPLANGMKAIADLILAEIGDMTRLAGQGGSVNSHGKDAGASFVVV